VVVELAATPFLVGFGGPWWSVGKDDPGGISVTAGLDMLSVYLRAKETGIVSYSEYLTIDRSKRSDVWAMLT
jgi:hypothetical protein